MTHLQLKLNDGRRVNVDTDRLADVHVAVHEATDEAEGERILAQFAENLIHVDESGQQLGTPGAPGEIAGILGFLRPAPKAVFEARMQICGGCEHASILKERANDAARDVLRCRQCGCIMNLKARLSFSACPIGKFPKARGAG